MKINYNLPNKKDQKTTLRLKVEDVLALNVLNEMRMFQREQYREVYNHFFAKMHDASFRRKMNEYAKSGLIEQEKKSIGRGRGFEFVSVVGSNAGLKLLNEIGLTQEENLFYKTNKHYDHAYSISQVFIEALKAAGEKYLSNSGEVLIPLEKKAIKYLPKQDITIYKNKKSGENLIPNLFDSFFGWNEEEAVKDTLISHIPVKRKDIHNSHALKPDWVFQMNETLIYIEVDSGTEDIVAKRNEQGEITSYNSIEGKLVRYGQVAEKMNNRKHVVIFVMMDNSITTLKKRDIQTARIRNLKSKIPRFQGYRQENLDVHVITLNRVSTAFEHIFDKARNKIGTEKEAAYISIKNNSSTYIRLIKNKGADFQKEGFPDTFNFPLGMIIAIQNNNTLKEQILVPVSMHEGSVKSMDKLDYFSYIVSQGRFKEDAKVLAIYMTEANLRNDVFLQSKKEEQYNGMDTSNIIFITLFDDEHQRFEPKFYDFNKRLVDLEDLL